MQETTVKVGAGSVMWEKASASRERMEAILDSAGHGKLLPPPPTVMACLKSALVEQFPSKKAERITIRPVEDGYAVVAEPPKDSSRHVGDDWGTVKATATLGNEDDEDTLSVSPHDYELRQRLLDTMRTKQGWLTDTEVGGILAELVKVFDGVAKRGPAYRVNDGYWMSLSNFEQWKAIANAIEGIPKRPGDKATTVILAELVVGDHNMLKSVTHAITAEVTAELATIEADIATGSLKEEACLNRLVKAGQLQQKVRRYEADMGTQLDALNAAIEKTSQAVAWTTLQVSNSAIVKDAMSAHC